jgi:glycolate oxidase
MTSHKGPGGREQNGYTQNGRGQSGHDQRGGAWHGADQGGPGELWTLAEQSGGELKGVSFELLARGRALADKLGVRLVSVLIGRGVSNEGLESLIRRGADAVYAVQDPLLEHFVCETYEAVLTSLIRAHRPSVLLAAATSLGRTLMPYTAVKNHTGLTADCTELDIEEGTGNLLQTRPAIGGNIMATIKTPGHRPQLATVRPKSSRPLPPDPGRTGELRHIPLPPLPPPRTLVTGYRREESGSLALEEADLVVAGGRGLKTAENFALIRDLARDLGAAVGASRDAVDRGWISYPHQVGLSGKTISPKVYIGAGISGAIQHLAGIKTSEAIVSINPDPDAALHRVADLGIVGDAFQVIPELRRRLAQRISAPQRLGEGAGRERELELEPECGAPGALEPVPPPHGPRAPAARSADGSPGPARNSGGMPEQRPTPSCYRPVTREIVAALREIAGPGNVVVDPEKLETYSHDETDAAVYGHSPEAVVLPGTTEQVARIVQLANRERIPLTPRGAGSGLSGGAVPEYGGIVISLEKMNRLLELDKDNMVAVVEAGMVTNDLANAVQAEGLFFAGYPMSLQTCVIGGNIAENAGGGKAVKYGVTGRYITGLELVSPRGDIVWLGGKLVKDVTGYDLKSLVIGSEGTLGIVTKAIVKLIGYPSVRADLLALFKTPKDAIDLVPLILSRGLNPTSIEFMDRLSIVTSCRYLNESLPYENAGAMLLIELDGGNAAQIEADLTAAGKLCRDRGALEVYVAEDRNNIERIWNVRRNIAEAIKVFSPTQSLEDIVVPPSRIPEIIPELERLGKKYRLQIPCYGHAGDGNLHATLVKDPAMPADQWKTNEDRCLRELYRVTAALGGKISGEHGIGIKRRDYLKDLINPVELELMRAIKRAWDPNNIMNPGKIFDG